MIRELADLLMPRTCLVCGRYLGVEEQHLCIWCAADLPLTYYWERVHNPMADEFNAVLERHRSPGENIPYVQAAALLFYHHENPYKLIPQALKYQGNIAAGRFFAARLGRYLAALPQWQSVDVVIPVPLHWRRKWERGYNQAQVIAAQLARELCASLCTRVLYRTRSTRTQTRLDVEDRLRNVAGVFRIRDGPLRRLLQGLGPGHDADFGFGSSSGAGTSRPLHVLLVDDTFTTGATLAACYQALRSALGHSVRISIATLAVVQD